MRALCFNPEKDEFELADLPQPELKPHDVLVRVKACGLNPVDAKIRLWQSMAPDMNPTWVPGLDVSGEIVHVGAAVTEWDAEDRVLYHGDMFRPHGGFAEYAVVDSRALVPHPNVDPVLAAASPCAGWTAWRALIDRLRLTGGHTLLIAGASGGVGGFAVQIARHVGAAAIIATCSPKNSEYVHQLGATHVLDYHDPDLSEKIRRIAPQGVDCGLDCVGGDNDILVANHLGYEGQMVELVRTVRPESYANSFMLGLGFHQLSLGSGHRNGERARDELVHAGKQVSALLEQGVLKVPQLETLTLEQCGAALNDMLNQRTVGKRVLAFHIA